MSILITGGHGYVGSHIHGDYRIGRSEFDLRNPHDVRRCLKKYSPNTVIHSAPGGIFSSHNNISRTKYLLDEIRIHCNVIENCQKEEIQRLLAISSISAFPGNISHPSEMDLFTSPPHATNFHYGNAKRTLEVLLQSVRDEYKLKYDSLFLSNVYGPGDNYYNHPSLIPHLIKSCIHAKKHNEDWVLSGDPLALRDYIFTKDLADIISNILKLPNSPCPLIVATGEEKSVQEVAKTVAKELDFKGKVKWINTQQSGQTKKLCNNDKFLKLFPTTKLTPFHIGIKKTVQWFLENSNEMHPKLRIHSSG